MILRFKIVLWTGHDNNTEIGYRELEKNERYELNEPQSPYNRLFAPAKRSLKLKNNHI
jgi:hypothetical protein